MVLVEGEAICEGEAVVQAEPQRQVRPNQLVHAPLPPGMEGDMQPEAAFNSGEFGNDRESTFIDLVLKKTEWPFPNLNMLVKTCEGAMRRGGC